MCHMEPHDRSLAGWLTPLVCVSVGAVSYVLRLASRRYVVGSIDTSDILLGICVVSCMPGRRGDDEVLISATSSSPYPSSTAASR